MCYIPEKQGRKSQDVRRSVLIDHFQLHQHDKQVNEIGIKVISLGTCARTREAMMDSKESYLRLSSNDEDSDDGVGVTGVETLSIGGPGERDAFGVLRVLSNIDEVGLELVDDGPAKKRRKKMRNGTEWSGRRVKRGSTDLDSRSKILTQDAVAAQSQYRLGLNTKLLMESPASRE